MENKVTSHLTKGLLIALVLIVISVIARLTGQEQATWVSWVSNLVLVACIIWSCIVYANQMNNAVTFGNVFAHGFKTSVVVTILVIVFTAIFLLIFPEVKQQAMDVSRQKMEEQNTLSEAQIDGFIDTMSKYFFAIAIGAIMFMDLLMGVIGSLIGAGVAKKNPPTPFGNQA